MLTCQPLWEIGYEIGLDHTIVSRIFNKFVAILLVHHGSKLYDNLEYFADRLSTYNRKLEIKIQAGGNLVPSSAEHVSCFTDGTRIQVCKPSRFDENSIMAKTKFIVTHFR